MKRFALFSIYWAASLLLLSVILNSMGYSSFEAMLLSTSLLPVAIIFRQMTARISFSANRREAAKSLVCLLLFVLIAAFLVVHIAQALIFHYKSPETYVWNLEIPPMLLNPVFLLSILTLMIIGDYGLGRVLGKRLPEAEETITFASDIQGTSSVEHDNLKAESNSEQITFFSNRQSVTLERQEILYVESCDTEVWIHATDGRRFRNKTAISSWGRLLGPEYLRIHRSYLVRISACKGLEHDNVVIGDTRLPVSRKYRENVQQCFMS